MPRLKHLRCPVCSAPLALSAEDNDVTCAYCHNAIHVERGRPPAGSAARAPGNTVYVGHGSRRMVAGVTAAAIFLAMIVGVVALLMLAKPPKDAQPAAPGLEATLAGQFRRGVITTVPARCPPNGEVRLEGVSYDGPGIAIDASANCRIRIAGSQLSADTVVRAGSNVEVVVVDSTLRARGTAVEVGANGQVRLEAGAALTGEAGLRAGANAEVELLGATIETTGEGIHLGGNGQMKMRQSAVRAGGTAVTLGTNGALELTSAELSSPGIAVRMGRNAKVSGEGGRISGGVKALQIDRLSVPLALRDTAVDGAQDVR